MSVICVVFVLFFGHQIRISTDVFVKGFKQHQTDFYDEISSQNDFFHEAEAKL